MRLRDCIRALMAMCLLVGAIPLAMAQQPTSADYQLLQRTIAEQEARLRQLETTRLPAVTNAASFYNVNTSTALESRMAELEEYVHGLGKGEENSTKPTQKWSGRVHYDYWNFPNDSPLQNFLESDPGSITRMPRTTFTGFVACDLAWAALSALR